MDIALSYKAVLQNAITELYFRLAASGSIEMGRSGPTNGTPSRLLTSQSGKVNWRGQLRRGVDPNPRESFLRASEQADGKSFLRK